MFLTNLINKIKNQNLTIVFTEGEDERILQCAQQIQSIGNFPVLLGNQNNIEQSAKKLNIDITDITIIDPLQSELFDELLSSMVQLRKGKQDHATCEKLLKQTNYFGTMLVQQKLANALVGGATYSTADTIRPALQLIKTKPDAPLVSSSFLLLKDNEVLVFGDCAINVKPNAEELSYIAKATAQTATDFGINPKVALLSYSTKGSGLGENVDLVRECYELLLKSNVPFEFEGELQFDAAIVPSVASQKSPGSKVAGNANVFIFPNLESGNIGYKIAQRLGNYQAIGPILQGLNGSINDLSRGCTSNDVFAISVISLCQSLKK